jgi:hypothetical protein
LWPTEFSARTIGVPERLFRIAVAAAVAIGCLAAVLPAPAPAFQRGVELTAIASRTHGAPLEILAFRPNGEPLSSLGRYDVMGAIEPLTWSPDGREYAYVDPGVDLPTLRVARPGDPEGLELGEPDYGATLVFDLDGDVVFPQTEPAGSSSDPDPETGNTFQTTLWAAPTDGTERRRLASFGPGVSVTPYSSASDGMIAAVVSTPQRHGIALFRLGKPGLRWVRGPVGGQISSPAISPDGSQIVYLQDRIKELPSETRLLSTKLMSVSTRGGQPEVLATIPGGARWPSWAPSGSRITFTVLATRERTGRLFSGRHSALMEMNADGSCLTTVYAARNGGFVSGSAWRPGTPGAAEVEPLSCRSR